jgi:hypothetical protein
METLTPSSARRVSALMTRTSMPVSLASASDGGTRLTPSEAAAMQALKIGLMTDFTSPGKQRLAGGPGFAVTVS